MHVFQLKQYPQLLSFWPAKDLLEQMKLDILKGIAQSLSERERYNKVDAQVTY